MKTLSYMKENNPNSWYLADRKVRERVLAKPDSDKLSRMERLYNEAMAGRETHKGAIIGTGKFQFENVPLYSQAWHNLQRKFKKYKMTTSYIVEKKPTDSCHWKIAHKDKRDMMMRDNKAGYIQLVSGVAS